VGTKLICPGCQTELFFEYLSAGDECKCPYCDWRGSIPESAENYEDSGAKSSYKTAPPRQSQGQAQQPAANDRPMAESSHSSFQTTEEVGKSVSALGWTVLVLSIVGGFSLIAAVGGASGMVLGSLVLVLGILQGLLIVVNGQLLQAIVSIANNTGKTNELLESLLQVSKKM